MKHEFEFNKFLRRKNLKQKEAAAIVGVSMGLIGTWASKKSLPSYEKMLKLIECGITAKELFGDEAGKMLIANSEKLSMDPSDFKEGVREALAEILNTKTTK